MSWRHRFTPSILRRVLPLLSVRSNAASHLPSFLTVARCASRLSPTTPNASVFDVEDIFGKALHIKGSLSENGSPADTWSDKSSSLKLPPPPDAWTGRRIVVNNSDLQSAFYKLNWRLRQNRVAKEIALTVRHEKKGDKRARLRSERWRKRFADAVRKKVQLVSTIRRRGG